MNKEAWFMQRQIEKQDWDYPPKCSVCGSDTPQHDCAIVLHGRLASTNEALIQIEQLACGQKQPARAMQRIWEIATAAIAKAEGGQL